MIIVVMQDNGLIREIDIALHAENDDLSIIIRRGLVYLLAVSGGGDRVQELVDCFMDPDSHLGVFREHEGFHPSIVAFQPGFTPAQRWVIRVKAVVVDSVTSMTLSVGGSFDADLSMAADQ